MADTSSAEALYSLLKQDIIGLKLKPGTPLRLPALAKLYAAGQTPLRECLNRLCGDRLVVTEHNKGFRVTPLSFEELIDLESARVSVEGTLFRYAVQENVEAWERELIGSYHMLVKHPAPSLLSDLRDVDEWTRRHEHFHDSLIRQQGNFWLTRFRTILGEQLRRYHRYIQIGLRDFLSSDSQKAAQAAKVFSASMAHEPHKQLYEAALSGDAELAFEVFKQHSQLSSAAFSSLGELAEAEDFFSLDFALAASETTSMHERLVNG